MLWSGVPSPPCPLMLLASTCLFPVVARAHFEVLFKLHREIQGIFVAQRHRHLLKRFARVDDKIFRHGHALLNAELYGGEPGMFFEQSRAMTYR